ncbi:MAG: nickel insertion protein [Candidatus Aenigmatarchaeota archaeon]
MIFIDARNGISGDMLLCALLSLLGKNQKKFACQLSKICSVMVPTKIMFKKVMLDHITAIEMKVKHQPIYEVTGADMIKYFEKALMLAHLDEMTKQFAMRTLNTLLRAESIVHGLPITKIHLHETGSPDTIADIVGVSMLCAELAAWKQTICGSWIATGRGKIEIAHGIVDVPAPATRIMLKGMWFKKGPYYGEMATPTGVALFKNLITQQQKVPNKQSVISGYGVGQRCFAGKRHPLLVAVYDK